MRLLMTMSRERSIAQRSSSAARRDSSLMFCSESGVSLRVPQTPQSSPRLEIGDVGPDDRADMGAAEPRQRVHVLDLPRVRLVGRHEFGGPRIGVLEVDIDQSGLRPKPKRRRLLSALTIS